MIHRLVLSAFLSVSLVACSQTGSDTTDNFDFYHEVSDLPVDKENHYGKLDNGLRYAVRKNATPSNTATLLMAFDTGSYNEKDDERGLAHFLEHMAFNGSENIPEGEMIKKLEKMGLAFGPDTNASTGFLNTQYQLELPEVNDEMIDTTLSIMRETASRLTLAPEAIERERGVILAEKRARESPNYRAQMAMLDFFLGDSLLPDRLPIGTEDSINSVTPEQFRAYYDGYYRPENTVIVLVGDMEPDYAIEKIKDYFGDWQAIGEAAEKRDLKALGKRGLEAGFFSDPEVSTALSLNVIKEPVLRDDTADNRRLASLEGIGNAILSRRLSRLAQNADAPFIGGGASSSTVYETVSVNAINMSCEKDKWPQALAVAEQELRKAYEFGFTQAEIDEVLANTRNSIEVSVQTAPTRRTPSLARMLLSNITSDRVMTTPASALERFEENAKTVTPEAVHKTFRNLWSGYETPQIYLRTSEDIDEAEEKILQALKNSQSVEVKKNVNNDLQGFAYTEFGPKGTISERGKIDDIDITTVKFANNVRLNIKKTPYRKDQIGISIAFGGGTLSLPENGTAMSWLAPSVFAQGGLEAHSADDIRSIMAGKTVGLSFSTGADRSFLKGTTTPKDLAHQLNYMMAYMTAPGYREEAKARYDKQIASYYPQIDSTPAGVARRDIPVIIRSGDKRFGIPPESDLLAATVDEVRNWIAPQLNNSAVEIGIVGDVDIEKVIDEVARTFGALPTRAEKIPSVDPEKLKLEFPRGQSKPIILRHAGEPTTALLQIYWKGPDGFDDMTRRHLGVMASMLKLRMTDILREDDASTYSPGVGTYASDIYPDYGYVNISVEVSPDKIDEVTARMRSIVADFKAGDMDKDLFKRAITPTLESIETSLENNGYWMNIVDEAQTDTKRLDKHRSREKTFKNMTLDDVKPYADQVFAQENALTFHILPKK